MKNVRAVSESAEQAAALVFAVGQQMAFDMNQGVEADRKPKVRNGHRCADKIAWGNSNHCKGSSVQVDRLAQDRGVAGKALLPIVLADEHARRGKQCIRGHGIEGPTTQSRDAEDLEVILGDEEYAGKLCVACLGRQQPQLSES